MCPIYKAHLAVKIPSQSEYYCSQFRIQINDSSLFTIESYDVCWVLWPYTCTYTCTVVCSLNGDLIKCHPTVISVIYMYHTCVVLNRDNIHGCYHWLSTKFVAVRVTKMCRSCSCFSMWIISGINHFIIFFISCKLRYCWRAMNVCGM